MLTQEFNDRIHQLTELIGLRNHGFIASHDIHSNVTVHSVDPDDDAEYELVDVSIDYLWGCSCPQDIVLKIRRIEDE